MDLSKPRSKMIRATGDWAPRVKVTVSVGGFDNVVMDQPEVLGGTNQGPGPMELVTAALIGCAGQTLGYAARELSFQFRGSTFEAEGEMDLRGFLGMPGVCRHFCSFRGTFTIDTDESDERLAQMSDLIENRCPVFNLLHDAGVDTNIVWRRK